MKHIPEAMCPMQASNGLSDIERQCHYDFGNVQRCIIGVMLLNPSNPQAFSILRGMDYYNARSGMFFNFYIPGQAYRPKWDHEEARIFERFDANAFADCIRDFERIIPDYHYSGKPELLFFNVRYGSPYWGETLLLQLDELEKSSGRDFEIIFEKIYQSIVLVNASSISDIGLDIGIDVASRSLLDSLKHLLGRIPFIGDLAKNSKGIYFK